MQIIKRGTKDQVECYGCGSVLAYSDADVKLRPLSRAECDPDDYREDRHASYITCPVCHRQNSVSASSSLKLKILKDQDRDDHDL